MKRDILISALQQLPQDSEICCTIANYGGYDTILSNNFGLFKLNNADRKNYEIKSHYLLGGEEMGYREYTIKKEIKENFIINTYKDLIKGE